MDFHWYVFKPFNLLVRLQGWTVKGLTIALLGDWGEGKNSVMKLLKKGLRETKDSSFVFAEFNAWQYEHTDNIAAALAQEVVNGLVDRFKWYDKLLLSWRFARKEYKSEITKTIVWLLIIAPFLLVLKYLDEVIFKAGVVGGLALAFYEFFKMISLFDHPVATKLETFLRRPNYGKHLGLMSVLKRHVKTLAELTLCENKFFKKHVIEKELSEFKYKDFPWRLIPQEKKRFIVFVDDLDKCQPKCIAKTLDAIRLVMDIENVIVMIGIDHRIAFKAVEGHYEELADGTGNRSAAEIARDYLAKIIQLPVRLIPSNKTDLKRFINRGLFFNAVEQRKSEPEKKPTRNSGLQPGSTGPRDLDNDAVEPPTDFGPEVVETIVERDKFYGLAVIYEYTNPRQLLRLRNSYRFLKVLNQQEQFKEELIMHMLFWQEFLHNWQMKTRGRCMAVLIDKVHAEKVEPIARKVLNNVKDDIGTLFNEEPTRYEELAKFVRVVVLPHNEERVLDSAEAIKDWLDLEKKAKEEEALRRKESNL